MTASPALGVAREAGEDLRGVIGIAAAVPEKKRAGKESGVEKRGIGGGGRRGG
jgi:hypothetical protein